VAELLHSTGFAHLTWRELVMIGVAGLLLWLAIAKKFEPLLLVPIGFGALMANLPLSGLMTPPHGEEIGGLFHYLSQGLRLEIFPPLIFLGLGALTDFGPLLANPKTLLLGGRPSSACSGLPRRWALGFTPLEAASIGIIGGADGPTSIYSDEARPPPARPDRRLGLLLHGARAAHPAADHALAHHPRGAAHPHGGRLRGAAVPPDHLPHRGHRRVRADRAGRDQPSSAC
jgi:hypothetical protein